MIARQLRTAALAVCATLGLSACTDGYGYGGGVYSAGVGYYDGYSDGYGGGWGPSYGWYDNYYYPGSGYYVFDRGGRRHTWNNRQRDYWRSRADTREDRREVRQNFRDYRQERRGDRSTYQAERRANREALRSGTISRDAFRAERRENRREFRQDRRGDRRQLFRENRRAVRD